MPVNDQPLDAPDSSPDVASPVYRSEDFTAVLEQTFALQMKHGNPLVLKLVAVEKSKVDNPGYDAFSLYFAPPEGAPPLPDNSYFLENATLGKVVMHLSATPASNGKAGGYEYEAVFMLRKT